MIMLNNKSDENIEIQNKENNKRIEYIYIYEKI